MNITFMIGNGFDLNLGLKTKFTDFYETYFKSELDRDVPESVKNFIQLVLKDKEKFGNMDKWSDFEKAFAENIQGTVDDVGEILEDFTVQFAEYLKKEEEKCNYSDGNIINGFSEFLCLSFNFLKLRDKTILKEFIDEKSKEVFNTKFINFNYTDTLDNLIMKMLEYFNSNVEVDVEVDDPEYYHKTYKYKFGHKSVHIHGNLTSDIVIGVDSKDQFKHQITGIKMIEDYAVKSTINLNSGNEYRDNYYIRVVGQSDIIYMYGLSLGKTDKSHWDVISDWIKAAESHKLIYFAYTSNLKQVKGIYSPKLRDEINKIKDDVLFKLGFMSLDFEHFYDQVLIIDSDDVLNFKLVNENKELEANIN